MPARTRKKRSRPPRGPDRPISSTEFSHLYKDNKVAKRLKQTKYKTVKAPGMNVYFNFPV